MLVLLSILYYYYHTVVILEENLQSLRGTYGHPRELAKLQSFEGTCGHLCGHLGKLVVICALFLENIQSFVQ